MNTDRDERIDRMDGDHDDDSHASTGGAAVAGAVTGGVAAGATAGGIMGAAAGPLGIAAGAAAGAAVGAVIERAMHGAAGHEHFEGDENHWAGDHDHTGDDDGHDHQFHYDLGYDRTTDRGTTGMERDTQRVPGENISEGDRTRTDGPIHRN